MRALAPLLAGLLAFAVSCSPSTNTTNGPEQSPVDPTLTGVWKVEAFSIDIPEMDGSLSSAAEQLALSTTYYLAKDSTFKRFDDYLPEGLFGEWRINSKTNELFYNFEFEGRNQAEIYTIEQVTDKSLVLTQNVFKGTVRMELKRLNI